MKFKFSDNNFFQLALIVSCILHAILLVGFYQSKMKLKELEKKVVEEKLRDMMFKSKPKKQYKPVTVKEYKKEVSAKQQTQKAHQSGQSPVPLVKDKMQLPNHFKSLDRRPQKLKGMKVSRQVAVPVLQSSKINSPAYVTYYQIVRDRIRQKAYNNYVQLKSGDVYMTFILLANGELKQIQVMRDKSADDPYLHEIGLESVHQASPFPSFPEDLKYPELTFNIVITFQFDEDW